MLCFKPVSYGISDKYLLFAIFSSGTPKLVRFAKRYNILQVTVEKKNV